MAAVGVSDVVSLALAIKSACDASGHAQSLLAVVTRQMDFLLPVVRAIDEEGENDGNDSGHPLFLAELQSQMMRTLKIARKVRRMNRVVFVLKASDVREELETTLKAIQLSLSTLQVMQNRALQEKLLEFQRSWEKRQGELREEAERQRGEREWLASGGDEAAASLVAGGIEGDGTALSRVAELERALDELRVERDREEDRVRTAVDSVVRDKRAAEAVLMNQIIASLEAVEMDAKNSLEQQKRPEGLPDACYCPLTREVMTDPVVVDARCSHTISREAYQHWINNGATTCPICRTELRSLSVMPNVTTRELIERLLMSHGSGQTHEQRTAQPKPANAWAGKGCRVGALHKGCSSETIMSNSGPEAQPKKVKAPLLAPSSSDTTMRRVFRSSLAAVPSSASPGRNDLQASTPVLRANQQEVQSKATSVRACAGGDEALSSIFSSLLSGEVKSNAAAAIIRGPPGTRHFGGNRGGLHMSVVEGERQTNRSGVGSIVACGTEKTVVYTYDRSPPGLTYPIGASGGITSDVMDSEGHQYLCCFLAKEKRMVVFELLSRTVVVELQMTTNLNFWRYLPPEAHGDTLCFMIITPLGGFHWRPLDETPRPKQAWKRSDELQGKKVVSYEEGGSNGFEGAEKRSSTALLLTVSSISEAQVQAWCLPLYGNAEVLCLSEDILGAALLQPLGLENGQKFLPHVVVASEGKNNEVFVEILQLYQDSSGKLEKGSIVAWAVMKKAIPDEYDVPEPAMAMGVLPPVLCCCIGKHVVVIIRKIGFISVYEVSEHGLSLVGEKDISQYVVDAAVCFDATEEEVKIVLLLCDRASTKDGCIATVTKVKDPSTPESKRKCDKTNANRGKEDDGFRFDVDFNKIFTERRSE